MDPVTIALVAAGLLAAYRIRRSSHPPTPEPEEVDEGEGAPPGYAIPAPTFGQGLPPAITAGRFSKERAALEAAGARTSGTDEDEPPELRAILPPQASAQAFESAAPDVAGVRGERAPRMLQWVTPLTGRYVGQTFLVPAGQYGSGTSSIKVLSPPVSG